MAVDTLLECRALEVGYRRQPLLPPLDFSLNRGEFWAVVGRNGSGKTTLLRTLSGLVAPLAGTVTRANHRVRISYLPQRTSIDPFLPLTAEDVVAQGCDRGWSFLQLRLARPALVGRCLRDLRAEPLAQRPFHQLSEGQRQRVLLARLAASTPDIAFLDEPTAAMDTIAEKESFAFLNSLRQRRGVSVVVVTHHLGAAQEFADKVVELDGDPSEWRTDG